MGESYRVYGFEPNKGAPIVFCVLFAISTAVHIYQNFKFKSWRVTGSLPWGGLLFIAGFAVREASVYNDHDLGLLIASIVLLQLAPPVYALTNYIILGRTFYYVPYLSPIHPGRVITTFVGLDFIIGILTGNGAAKAANPSNGAGELKIGAALIRASIMLQLICFVGFIALEIVFHRRCVRAKIINAKLRTMLYVLYFSSSCILLRNLYRVVEVWQGYDGYLATHEAFLYVFDGALMLLNTALLNVIHPMATLPLSWRIYLANDGVTELEGDCVVDKRPLWVTLLDPFDLVGLIKGRDRDDVRNNLMPKGEVSPGAGMKIQKPTTPPAP